jgi:predicted O-methyltransferase YrrM
MELNLKLEKLTELTKDFPNDIIDYFGYTEDVTKNFGQEHYKLLAGISMQKSNIKILEIGTHKGQSAVCLTYGNKFGNNITLNTYDICEIIFPQCKKWFSEYNINFYVENLFDNDIRENKKDYILSHDIIFIDIDPHEGILELEMYNWLKNNNYQGIIIFDDIYLGRGHFGSKAEFSMSEFWKKLDLEYKIDVSKVGHHSGTGIINFNPNNKIYL